MDQESGNFQSISECITAISAAKRIVITAHPKPDGDALGSSLALKYALEKVGKQAVATGLEPVPNRYQSFVKSGDIISVDEALAIEADLIIALDAGSIERIPKELSELKGKVKILNIDHHISNVGFGDINLIDTDSCSTGEIVYQLLMAGGYAIDQDIATLLWIAIVTDTGRFAYSNTTPQAMHTAAELLKYGVNTEDVDRKIYRQLSKAELAIRKIAIQNLEFRHEEKIAFVTLTTADFDAAGCTVSDTEDIIEIPRCVEGVDVAVLFYEDKGNLGRINISMRSNGDCDLAELCASLGGGGHAKAAGCRVKGSMSDAQEIALQAVTARLR